MGRAYRGDVTALLATELTTMTPEQLQELSTAAAMLANAADEELTHHVP